MDGACAAFVTLGLNSAALTVPHEDTGSFTHIQPSLSVLYLHKPYLAYPDCMRRLFAPVA